MLIRLVDIPPEGRLYEGEEDPAVLGLGAEDDPRAEGAIHYRLKAVHVPGTLVVTGRLSVPVRFSCVRCNRPFSRIVEEPAFDSAWQLAEDASWVPQHIDEDEDTTAAPTAADAESVDLTPDMREAIILAFPSYPLCRPDCRGLCTRCGGNLNEAACTCGPPEDDRWSQLDELTAG